MPTYLVTKTPVYELVIEADDEQDALIKGGALDIADMHETSPSKYRVSVQSVPEPPPICPHCNKLMDEVQYIELVDASQYAQLPWDPITGTWRNEHPGYLEWGDHYTTKRSYMVCGKCFAELDPAGRMPDPDVFPALSQIGEAGAAPSESEKDA